MRRKDLCAGGRGVARSGAVLHGTLRSGSQWGKGFDLGQVLVRLGVAGSARAWLGRARAPMGKEKEN